MLNIIPFFFTYKADKKGQGFTHDAAGTVLPPFPKALDFL